MRQGVSLETGFNAITQCCGDLLELLHIAPAWQA